ncbi:MAG: hypothetical protein HZB42_07680 [Sphingobacteriales bacterium]|nr:hypothetical protein [Sphingobacteriales bacterium]
MKKLSLQALSATFALTLVVCVIIISFINGCRKLDMQETSRSAIEVKFFNSHRSSESLVQTINGFMQRQNAKYNFVERTVKQIGYPYWDKAISVTEAATQRSETDSTVITYIPFVRDSQNIVNAALIVKTTATDTIFRYLCDWQYANPDSTTRWSPRNVFHIFSRLENYVFGRNKFRITDEIILSERENDYMDSAGLSFDSVNVNYTMEPLEGISGRNNLWALSLWCDNAYICLPLSSPFSGTKSNLSQTSGGNCASGYFLVVQVCTETWTWEESPGGGNGEPGGGGSGGGTGGPPPPPCGTSNPNRSSVTTPCGPGWTPIEEPGGGGSSPPNDSIIAENLKRLIQKSLNKPDSLHYEAQQDGNERTFTFVKTVTGDTAIMWIKTGTSHSSSPTLTYNSFAIFHTHQEDDPTGGSDKNQCFDGPDIYKLYKNVTVDGYPIETSIITTRDYYYAAVITDPIKFRDYIRTLCGSSDIKFIATQLVSCQIDNVC